MSATLAEEMAERLRERLKPDSVTVEDESWRHEGHAGANGTGFGTHFLIHIQSASFAGLSRVARHRQVYDALQDFIADRGVHAIAIDAHE